VRRHAIGGAAGGKHQPANILIETGIQKRQAAADIVAVIFTRIFDGFANIGVGRAMNDEGRRKLLERSLQQTAVENVTLDEGSPANRIRVTR